MKSMVNQSDAFADPRYFPVELAIMFSCYWQLWDELCKDGLRTLHSQSVNNILRRKFAIQRKGQDKF